MKKLTFDELYHEMLKHGRKYKNNEDSKNAIYGVIVYSSKNWPDKNYSEKERSYRVSSCNKCFQVGKISNSMFGDCLDDTDLGVRLDWYDWEIDYCYMLEA